MGRILASFQKRGKSVLCMSITATVSVFVVFFLIILFLISTFGALRRWMFCESSISSLTECTLKSLMKMNSYGEWKYLVDVPPFVTRETTCVTSFLLSCTLIPF